MILETTKARIDNPKCRWIRGKEEQEGYVTNLSRRMYKPHNQEKTITMLKSMGMSWSNSNQGKMMTNSAFLISKFLKFYGEEFGTEPIN